METYEQKVRRVLTKEAGERLIIAIHIYNNTLRSEESSRECLTGDIWFGLIGMMVAFPSGVTIFFLFMFLVGLIKCFARLWRVSFARDVCILENPEEAATYRFNKRFKLQPINSFPLLPNTEGQSRLMENLYDDIITDEMKSDRDLVVKKLMEAGLRHVISEALTGNPTYIDFTQSDREEPEEDSFWQSDED